MAQFLDCFYFNFYQLKRLVTHEDARFFHLHKVLGFATLFHFAHRLSVWKSTGNLGFDGSYTTLALIAMHALLHVSSFEFIISNRRNKVYNIIWPEMRWHSLIFAYRSLAVMALVWAFKAGLVGSWIMFARAPLVILTMVAADYVTRIYQVQDTTMRGNPYPTYIPPWYVKIHNYFYSVSQVFATLNMLFRGSDLAFLSLIPIQTAPFCMTLQKKGIITQGAWHYYYTVALLINFYYAVVHDIEHAPQMKVLALAFAVGRFGFGMNKYLLWGAIAAYQVYLLATFPPVLATTCE